MCSSLNILWHCLSLGLERKLTFSSPMDTVEFSKFAGLLSAVLSEHHLLGFEIAQLKFHEFEYTPGVGDGQGGLVCCSPWGRKESDTTERLN